MPRKNSSKRLSLTTADYAELAAFRRTLREFLRFSENATKAAGLSSRRYQALLMLRVRDGGPVASIDDLAREFLIRHHSAVGLVDRLARDGLVARARSTADRRRVELKLTSKGRRLLAGIAAIHRVELRRIGPAFRRFFARMRTAGSRQRRFAKAPCVRTNKTRRSRA